MQLQQEIRKKSNKAVTADMPLVSVCIPAYNSEKYIGEAIESVLTQTYKNFELIILDDVSTDNTLKIARSYDDERIKVIENPKNLGLVKNFAELLKHASGKYFKLLCNDDLLMPNALEAEVRILEKYPDVSVVTGSSFVIDGDGKVVIKRNCYKKDTKINGMKFSKKTFNIGRNLFGEPTVTMFRTQQAKEADIYNDESVLFCNDWDACVYLTYVGNVFYLSNPIAKFRISANSTTVRMTKSKSKRIFGCSIAMLEKHRKYGKIKLNAANELWFKIMTFVNMKARSMIIAGSVKKRSRKGEVNG